MPNVLIVSASTGLGHNQAAGCLKNELEAAGYQACIVEPIKEDSRFIDLLIDNGFRILTGRMPKMYGRLYRVTERKLVNKGVATFLNVTLRNTLFQMIEQHKPDLLISTHPLLVNAVSFLKATSTVKIPFIAVVTDYMAHQFYVNDYVDAYIVGSKYTKDTLTAKGIPKDKIYAYGIPIRREFRQHSVIHKEGRKFTLLLMGGSMGFVGIKECLKELVDNQHPFRLLVVCGNNTKLKLELEEKYPGPVNGKEIVIYGFTTEIPELMDQSDLILTKPGGLTVSEAINKNIPMIIPFCIPGQEEENAEVLVRAGVAVRAGEISELNRIVDHLYHHPALMEEMRQKAREFSRDLSPDSIVSLADRLVFNLNSSKHRVQTEGR